MTTRPERSPAPDSAPPRRRLTGPARQAQILEMAAEHFATQGFSGTTRALADAVGVTQAALYKHFGSKAELIERTLDAALGQGDGPAFPEDGDLSARLAAFYVPFCRSATETRMKLFMRAGMDGRSWPTRRGDVLTRRVFLPVIAALRQTAGLPGLAERPAMRGERELAMMLHAAMVFIGIRRHVYGMPMPDSMDDVVLLYIRTFLDGALPAIRDLHAGGPDSLTVTLLARDG